MKNCILLFPCLLIINCNSQQKIGVVAKNNAESQNVIEYFLGNWKFVEKRYIDGDEKKIYPLQECMKKYIWQFQKENQQLFLTKNYFTGKNCSVKSSSGKITISIQGSSIFYTEADLKRKENFTKISKNSFSFNYRDILNGKVRQIEDIYERQ